MKHPSPPGSLWKRLLGGGHTCAAQRRVLEVSRLSAADPNQLILAVSENSHVVHGWGLTGRSLQTSRDTLLAQPRWAPGQHPACLPGPPHTARYVHTRAPLVFPCSHQQRRPENAKVPKEGSGRHQPPAQRVAAASFQGARQPSRSLSSSGGRFRRGATMETRRCWHGVVTG